MRPLPLVKTVAVVLALLLGVSAAQAQDPLPSVRSNDA